MASILLIVLFFNLSIYFSGKSKHSAAQRNKDGGKQQPSQHQHHHQQQQQQQSQPQQQQQSQQQQPQQKQQQEQQQPQQQQTTIVSQKPATQQAPVPVPQPAKPSSKTSKMKEINSKGANKEGTDMDAFNDNGVTTTDVVNANVPVRSPSPPVNDNGNINSQVMFLLEFLSSKHRTVKVKLNVLSFLLASGDPEHERSAATTSHEQQEGREWRDDDDTNANDKTGTQTVLAHSEKQSGRDVDSEGHSEGAENFRCEGTDASTRWVRQHGDLVYRETGAAKERSQCKVQRRGGECFERVAPAVQGRWVLVFKLRRFGFVFWWW